MDKIISPKIDLDVMNLNEQEREAYEDHIKWLRMEASALEKRFSDGKQEGKKERKQEEKEVTARLMLKLNMSLEVISQCTRLSIEEIQKLKILEPTL